jgi:glycosyltransferase involved in cell wall biosynthesis
MMREPRSVLHLVHRWEAGGVQRHILDLGAEQHARGLHVRVAAWLPDTTEPDASVLALPLFTRDGQRKSAMGFYRSMQLLRRVLADERFDVLHMHSRYTTPLGSLAARNLPVALVYTAHSAFMDLGFLPWYPRHVICPGVAVRAAFLKSVRGAAQQVLHLVPHGVTVPASSPRAAASADVPLFLFLGRFAATKGGDVLIDALALLARKGARGWRAAFVGDGPAKEDWQRRVHKHALADVIRFESWTSDPTAWLRNATALVMPSVSLEGLPMSMLEAMAAGCPVIASDLPPFAGEIVNGETGLLFRNKDAAQLAGHLAHCLEMPLQMRAMAEAAHAAVLHGHSLSRMGDETLAVYREALSGVG